MINFKPFQNLYQQIKAKDMRLFETLDKISAYLQNIGTIIDSMFDARGNLTVLNGVNLQIPNKLIKVTTPGVLGLSNVSDDGTTVTIPESVLVDLGAGNPTNDQMSISCAGVGALGFVLNGADNAQVHFDCIKIATHLIARYATLVRIIKNSGELYFSVSSGQTVGTALNTTGVTSIPVVLNLTTGNMGFGGTAAPAYPVDVTGTVNATGGYCIGGVSVIAPTELANTALMGPVSGGAALPSFRALTAADVPSINATQVNGASIPSSAPLLQTNLSGQLISRTDGVTGVMPIPKLTTLGSNGSIAFLNGVVTAYVNPT